MKRCNRCGQEKPLEEFYLHGSTQDGRGSACKECTRQRRRERYTVNRAQERQQQASYYDQNSERIKANSAAYRLANPEWKKNYDADYAQGESYRDYQSSYRRTHRERLNLQRRIRYAADPRFRKRIKLNAAMRRARKAMAPTHPFTEDQLRAKLEFWNNACWICGDPPTEIDHVKPMARGGSHIIANFRPICIPCNRAKGAQWPIPCRAKLLKFY